MDGREVQYWFFVSLVLTSVLYIMNILGVQNCFPFTQIRHDCFLGGYIKTGSEKGCGIYVSIVNVYKNILHTVVNLASVSYKALLNFD